MKLEVKKKLLNRSERVKSVDLHPTLPWVLIALYVGNVTIFDYDTQTQVRSLEITNSPVRCAKFIARKQWIIVGADDTKLRVYNYNTAEKLKTIEDHSDYIRHIVVHPTLPYVLSCSDDDTIKMFDWDKNWAKVNSFQDHEHYIMQLAINPKDPSMFASASLDKRIKIWTIGTTKTVANYTLSGHEAGVNSIDFSWEEQKPHLVSGDDLGVVKIWDYQTRICLYTFDQQGGHSENVSSVIFHPDLPIIISAGEDDLINIWDCNSYKQITQLQYGLKRVWSISAIPESNYVAFGFDEGTIVVKLGNDNPLASYVNGKVVWIKKREIQTFNLKLLQGTDEESKDGELVRPQNVKELGICEITAQNVKFAPSGRYFAVLSDSDYIIYAYPKFSNAAFGQATDLVWSSVNSSQTHSYACRTDTGTVKVFQNFAEFKTFKTSFSNDGIFGGRLLAIKSKDFITFYDWEEFHVIRRIDVASTIKQVIWSEDGRKIILALEDTFYLLQFNSHVVDEVFQNGGLNEDQLEDGIEEAFTFVDEFSEVVVSGQWVSNDCFTFINNKGSLNYLIGGRVMKLGNTGKKQHILGYDSKQNRLYLVDKLLNVHAHRLLMCVIEFQNAILNKEVDAAKALLSQIPESQFGKLAKFLETNNQQQMAYEMSPDQNHKFELALVLNYINDAFKIADQQASVEKWRKVGDIALAKGQFALAQECFEKSADFNGLLLIYSSYNSREGLIKLAQSAQNAGKLNIAYEAAYLLGDVDRCLDILIKAQRMGEAAFFARVYSPSRLPEVTQLWAEQLKEQGLPFQPESLKVQQSELQLEEAIRGVYRTN